MTQYNWERYWCQREGNLQLTESGYLVDLNPEWAHYYSDIVPFKEIAKTPCLVLLGERGIGKSTAMRMHYERPEGQSNNSHEITLRFDLNPYTSDTRLIGDIFQQQDFLSWNEDKQYPLHLFLDSLDECSCESTRYQKSLWWSFERFHHVIICSFVLLAALLSGRIV